MVQKNTAEHIQSLVDRETEAWNKKDAETLVSLFHPDMVWPWPAHDHAHDPADWIFTQGRFNKERWKNQWNELFRTHELIHNKRRTIKITVSKEEDGAIAIVDVDTLWKNTATGKTMRWNGRSCKGYTKVGHRWFLIFHTGLLDYTQHSV